jgi:hypothetical protein
MLAKQTRKFVEIPINEGTKPEWETRLGYPKLFNMFVGEDGMPHCMAWRKSLTGNYEIENVRAIIETKYQRGSYLILTSDVFLRLDKNGRMNVISVVKNNNQPVQIAENQQFQVGFVDGQNFYVYTQGTNELLVMGEDQGFSFTSPISITIINNIAIVLDKDTGEWAISEPNQMLLFPALDGEQRISSALGGARTLNTINDNLYIFGSTGVEKWIPSSGNSPYLFPFAKDNSFRIDFGAISVNGSDQGFSELYFVSSNLIPMVLTSGGVQPIGGTGMAKVFSKYPDNTILTCNFYKFLGNYFFHVYFPVSNISWVYCTNSKTWSLTDDHVVASVTRENVVADRSGIFMLTDDDSFAVSKKREFQSKRLTDYKGTETYRMLLNAVEARIIQGYKQLSTVEPQHLRLNISLDSEKWLNPVPMPIGNTGERNAVTIWRTNLSSHEFTVNLQYQGQYRVTIEKLTAIIK